MRATKKYQNDFQLTTRQSQFGFKTLIIGIFSFCQIWARTIGFANVLRRQNGMDPETAIADTSLPDSAAMLTARSRWGIAPL